MQQLGSTLSTADSSSSKLPQLPLPVIETNSIKVLCGGLPSTPTATGTYTVSLVVVVIVAVEL